MCMGQSKCGATVSTDSIDDELEKDRTKQLEPKLSVEILGNNTVVLIYKGMPKELINGHVGISTDSNDILVIL